MRLGLREEAASAGLAAQLEGLERRRGGAGARVEDEAELGHAPVGDLARRADDGARRRPLPVEREAPEGLVGLLLEVLGHDSHAAKITCW